MSATRSEILKSALPAMGIAGSCLVVAFVSLHSAYPSAVAAAKFLAYVVVFNLLPGISAMRVVLPKIREVAAFFIFALAIGIVVNTLAVTAFWVTGQMRFIWLLPVPAGLAVIGQFRRINFSELADRKFERADLHWILGVAFCCVTGLLGEGYLYVNGGLNDGNSLHFAFQGVVIRGLEAGWPPPNLLLPGVAWSYNYAAHLWLMGVNLCTGVPIDVLVGRYGSVFLGSVSAALLWAFGRYAVGLGWWIATLPVFCVYWLLGITHVSGKLFASFMPYGGNLILSPLFAIIVFLVIIAVAAEPSGRRPAFLIFRFVLLAALAFLATGARGVCTPILLCAAGLRLLVSTRWRTESSTADNVADFGALALGFVAGLRFFFTIGTGFTGAGVLKFTGEPFTYLTSPDQTVLSLGHALMDLGMAWLPAGIIAFAIIAIFQAAFLTPALASAFAEIKRQPRDIDIILIGCAIAGLAGFFLTVAPGLSHISFLYFSNISCSLLGAWGLQKMLRGSAPGQWRRPGFESAILLLICAFACLHLSQLPFGTAAWVGKQWATSAWDLVTFSPGAPRADDCISEEDSNLFASAGKMSKAAVVIVIPGATICGPFWWIVRSPVQSLSDYMLAFVPGTADKLSLQSSILIQKQHMEKALALAKDGVLSVPDVMAMAGAIEDEKSVFVMAPRKLAVPPDSGLQLVGEDGAFALWKLVDSRSSRVALPS